MEQTAPDPVELAELVESCAYRPGWTFDLDDIVRDRRPTGEPLSQGLTLIITTHGYDSYHPNRGETYGVRHYRPVPPATYDRRSWRRWLFEQILLVEQHEAAEFFQVDGQRPYKPSHGPGNDPYMIREVGTELDQRTSFRGAVNDA